MIAAAKMLSVYMISSALCISVVVKQAILEMGLPAHLWVYHLLMEYIVMC